MNNKLQAVTVTKVLTELNKAVNGLKSNCTTPTFVSKVTDAISKITKKYAFGFDYVENKVFIETDEGTMLPVFRLTWASLNDNIKGARHSATFFPLLRGGMDIPFTSYVTSLTRRAINAEIEEENKSIEYNASLITNSRQRIEKLEKRLTKLK
jgi:hypothetical protein